MGVFNNWPYTDVHQLNLDFILEVAKEAKEAYDNIEVITQAAQDAKTAAQLSAAMAARSAERAETSENQTLAYYNNVIQIGTPIVLNEAADMTQYNRVYLYTGNEAGYEFGHWYYYDDIDGEWKDGGEYGVGSGITANANNLLKYVLERVAYTETGMQVYVDALYQALAGGGGGGTTTYTITNALSNVTNSNSATSCDEGDSYSATLTADTDYTIDSVVITMGGVDVTSTVYNNGIINIAAVTGDLVITALGITNVLYRLATAFTSSGSNYIDTGVHLEANKEYTIAIDFTIATMPSDVRFVYGDAGSLSTGYSSIAIQNNTGNPNVLWGSGLSWSNGQNLGYANHRYRIVATVETTNFERNVYFKDIT